MTKKTEYLPIGKLDDWWNSNLREETRIRIEAKLSSAKQNNAEWQPVLELGNARAQTCKITIAEAGNPFAKKGNEQIKKWFRGWAATLTAASLVTPVFDRIRFRELSRKQEHRRLRLFVDTNAIAQGAVQWLLSALGRRADILTSAVVDRELAAWPDREANFWRPTSIDSWKLRTHYRLARQITETPPADHLIDRLSPQQAALLLAKFRDEDSSAKKKSPDADVLLVEIARSLVRDQPRGARVLFLTGDRNCARTAVSALGSENVFYVACDDTRAEKAITDHKICIRGSWSPDGGSLGTYHLPRIQEMIRVLLAAADELQISAGDNKWSISPKTTIERGAPSDWVDPWVGIQLSKSSASTKSPAESNLSDWLLPPIPQRPSVGGSASWRLDPSIFFTALVLLLRDSSAEIDQLGTSQTARETIRSIDQLHVRERMAEFKDAWTSDDHDWFHAELLRLTSYRQAIEALRESHTSRLSGRMKANLMMARALGQASRTQPRGGTLVLGDSPLRANQLRTFLEQCLGSPGESTTTQELASQALTTLHLAPARFERALKKLWEVDKSLPFKPEIGGSSDRFVPEKIIMLGKEPIGFREVDPGVLMFGRKTPVRYVTWSPR